MRVKKFIQKYLVYLFCFVLLDTNVFADQLNQRQKICDSTLVKYKEFFKYSTEKYLKEKSNRVEECEVKNYLQKLRDVKFEFEHKLDILKIFNKKEDEAKIKEIEEFLKQFPEEYRQKEEELELLVQRREDKVKRDAEKILNSYNISTKAYPLHPSRYTDDPTFVRKDAKCKITFRLNPKSEIYKILKKKMSAKQIDSYFVTYSEFYGPFDENYNKEFEKWYSSLVDWQAEGKIEAILNDTYELILDGENSVFFKGL